MKAEEETTSLGDCLTEAKAIICGERQDSYGAPEDSFAVIAGYWDVYLGNRKPGPLSALDAAHMMVLFKMARCSGQKACRDNYVDLCGYAAIAADRMVGIPDDGPDGGANIPPVSVSHYVDPIEMVLLRQPPAPGSATPNIAQQVEDLGLHVGIRRPVVCDD